MDLQWLENLVPDSFFNISLLVHVLSCNKIGADSVQNSDEPAFHDSVKRDISFEGDGFVDTLTSFLSDVFSVQQRDVVTENAEEEGFHQHHQACGTVLDVQEQFTLRFHTLLVYAISFCAITLLFSLFVVIKNVARLRNQKEANDKSTGRDEDVSQGTDCAQELDKGSSCLDGGDQLRSPIKKETEPVVEKVEKIIPPVEFSVPKLLPKSSLSLKLKFSLEDAFDHIVGIFLKELDRDLGMDSSLRQVSVGAGPSMSLTSNTYDSLTSPRLERRGIVRSRSRVGSQSMGTSNSESNDENVFKFVAEYQKLVNRMNWTYPEGNVDDFGIHAVPQGNEKLKLLLQFLHQNSSVSRKQWNVACSLVNFSLFILEREMLKLSEESKEICKIVQLESIGSASDGTHTGSLDTFDVLVSMRFVQCTDYSVLHNNFFEEIPPGHVVLGLKDSSGENALKNSKLVKLAFINGCSGFYLKASLVEELVDIWLKKAVARLGREHKNKTDRLPFKIQTCQSKKLAFSLDTRLLQGLGLGVGEIQVKLLPTFSLSGSTCSLLPPLLVVPSLREDHRKPLESTSPRGALSRIFRDQAQNANKDFYWSLFVNRIESAIISNIEQVHLNAGVYNHHKVCTRILKALFSESSKSMLLNKGEVSAHTLSTIVHFLMQESQPSAWDLASLPDRVSDAVHFLRSSYENAWLPNFVIHNPHLAKQYPSLSSLSPLLMGRQQNLLADVSNDAAMKVLDFIELRLQKSGLIKTIKPEFSTEMWEYEFFMFG